MTYTTNAIVREETGLRGDPNVSDTMINTYIDQSHAVVQSFCAAVYDITYLNSSNDNFVDSPAEDFLGRVETLMASGYLLIKLYGGDVDGDKNGYEKIGEAKALLKMLTQKDPLRLIGADGSEMPRSGDTPIKTLSTLNTLTTNEPVFKKNDEY